MEEKILIEGKQKSIVKFIPVIIAIVCTIITVIIELIEVYSRWDSSSRYTGQYTYAQMLKWTNWSELIVFFAVFLVIGFIIAKALTAKITITDKRVYGTTAFGKRVDLPLDSISSIGTSVMDGVAMTTSSGIIKFAFMDNAKELHQTASKLIIERQKQIKASSTKPEAVQGSADELKKYKDLLDNGIITQEEFDTKKKQLLGL